MFHEIKGSKLNIINESIRNKSYDRKWTPLGKVRYADEVDEGRVVQMIANNWPDLENDAIAEIYEIRSGRKLSAGKLAEFLPNRKVKSVESKIEHEPGEFDEFFLPGETINGRILTPRDIHAYVLRFVYRVDLLYTKGFIGLGPAHSRNGRFRCFYIFPQEPTKKKYFMAKGLHAAIEFLDNCEREHTPPRFQVLMAPTRPEYRQFVTSFRAIQPKYNHKMPNVLKTRRIELTMKYIYEYYEQHNPDLLRPSPNAKNGK